MAMTRHIPVMLAACFMLVAIAALLGGCAGAALVAHAVSGADKVPAEHKLLDARTLVLVDDPGNRLGDPTLRAVVANSAIFHLRENKALSIPAVTQQEINDLRSDMGGQFDQMSLDQVGRMVDARQVIHIQIGEVVRDYAPGVYRPNVVSQVRVIDVQERQRLFPAADSVGEATGMSSGHPVVSRMRARSTEAQGMANRHRLDRRLAEVVGRDVARLFFEWKRPEPGTLFDDEA